MKLKEKTQGIVFIIFSGFFFAMMSMLVAKAGNVPTLQKAFFRNLVASAIALFMLLRSPEGFRIKREGVPYLLGRSVCGTIGLVLHFYTLDRLPISDANLLNKLSPFFAVAASAVLLKEKANKFEWGALVLAFIGALFVIRPSADMHAATATLGMISGLSAGVAYTFVRKLGKLGERGPVIVAVFSLFSCAVLAPFVIAGYEPMQTEQLLFLLGAGAAAAGGQLCITAAYTKAQAKDISVYDYTQILFAALLGYFFLGQTPDHWSFVGYAVILGAAVFKWRYDKRAGGRAGHADK